MTKSNSIKSKILLLTLTLSILISLHTIDCLYEDQKGKFDWHKKFIGIPKLVYYEDKNNLIIGTESNVVASVSSEDGSIMWRQLLPPGCELDHMSIMKSVGTGHNFIIRTSCKTTSGIQQTQYWNPANGLAVSNKELLKVSSDEKAETLLADQGHVIGNSKVFTFDNDRSLIVYEDGSASLHVRDESLWTREESLASIIAVEIVQLPEGMRDKFGLRKRIVALTEAGKIFAIDTFTGDIEWQIFERELSTKEWHGSKAQMHMLKQSDQEASDFKAVAIHPKGFVIMINPVTGKLVDKIEIGTSIKQIAQTELFEPDIGRGLIILDSTDKVHVLPKELTEKTVENIDKYYLTVVEKSPPTLQGFRFLVESDSIIAKPTWEFQLSKLEKIVSLQTKRIDEEVHSPARALGDRGILYKYVNPNLIAIMTQSTTGSDCLPEYSINIYLVDGITGALVHSVYHPKSRDPTNMVHSENWLVYSYYNTKYRRTEVSSLELFEGSTQANSTAFSSLSRSAIKPRVIEHKTFIFPSGINAMIDTNTLRGMTNKHLIVALPSGGLLEIPKLFLDPRRPINMLMEHREEGLIPYMPELPIPSESIINYDRSLLMVRGITTSPARLESTSLVFAYGLDLFFTRVTPSKTFDILKDDFDHVLITGVLIFLIVASYVSKLLAQRKALHAAWK